MRKVILHYHLFKNAGSSVDRMLRESFPGQWRNFDKTGPGQKISAAEMAAYIEDNPGLKAVSSHQIVPPLPVPASVQLLPIVLLREPLDRVRSAWLFEWQKQLKLEEPKGTLREYVEEKLAKGKGSVIANFQVFRLCNQNYNETQMVPGLHEVEKLEYAKEFLSSIPFFGLVERFDESLLLLKAASASDFPELNCTVYRENVSQKAPAPLKRKYIRLKKELGDSLYHELLERNRLDLQLHSYACGLFEERLRSLRAAQTHEAGTVGMDNAQLDTSGLTPLPGNRKGPSVAA